MVRRLLDSGVPVERYYHWTLMDNFEWALGLTAPFGLYACDFETQKRTLRRAGAFFSEICRGRAVTADMIGRYLQ
jgi:beta-glucosidase